MINNKLTTFLSICTHKYFVRIYFYIYIDKINLFYNLHTVNLSQIETVTVLCVYVYYGIYIIINLDRFIDL